MSFLKYSLLFFLGFSVLSCGGDNKNTSNTQVELPPPVLESFFPSVVVPGSILNFKGSNFPDSTLATVKIVFSGFYNSASITDKPIEFSIIPISKNAFQYDYIVDDNFFIKIGGIDGTFTGKVEIHIVPLNSNRVLKSNSVNMQLQLSSSLVPVISSFPNGLFINTNFILQGTNFINKSEGSTVVRLNGNLTRDSSIIELNNIDLHVIGIDRTHVDVKIPVWAFGIKPGRFTGTVVPVNYHSTGRNVMGNEIVINFEIYAPTIFGINPDKAGRGQSIRISGGGYIPSTEGATFIEMDGIFVPKNAPDSDGIPMKTNVYPHVINGSEMDYLFHVLIDSSGHSDDIGMIPGVLKGDITPIVEYNNEQIKGEPYNTEFTILSQKQVVYIKFLPSFTDSLRLFGMRNVELFIIEQIFDVLYRDYMGHEINVEFRKSEPIDFVEYSTVEIGGPDQNDYDLFGLDNTAGLDKYNKRFDDNLGGRNADSGHLYGGIFLESFLKLSEKSQNPSALSNSRFDDIFYNIIKNPIESGEFPGGSRDNEIFEAIRVLGNLIGNTTSHEVGHSLGLALVPGCDEFHSIDGVNQLMDCGADRPFEERAELDGFGPQVFTQKEFDYLKTILPTD